MSLPPAIDVALRQFAARRRRVAAVRVGLSGLAIAGAWLLAAALADRWVSLSNAGRCGALSVTVLIVMVGVWRIVRRALARKFDALREARAVEAADAAWRERLATVVTQSALPSACRGSTALNHALADEVSAEMATRPPVTLVRRTAVRRAAAGLGVVALCWMIAMTFPTLELPTLLGRHARPWADVPAVGGVRIELLPHALAVPQGNSLAVVADLVGGTGPVIMEVGPDLTHLRPIVMSKTFGERYTTTLLSLQEDLVYRVAADGASAGPVTVRVLRRPGVTRMDITLATPDGRAPSVRPDSDGQLRVAAGTKVAVALRVTHRLRAAAVHVGVATVGARPDTDRRTWRAEFVAEEPADWSIELVGEDGINGQGPDGMRIRVIR